MVARELLSRDRVLRAARDLADECGVSALSMRRVAGVLGVEAMSLYHHLPGKEGLLDGLAEQVVAEIQQEVADVQGSDDEEWRVELRQRCLSARRVMLRHPWAPGLLSTRANVPPNLWTYYDDVLATMVRGGLDYHLAHRGMHALGSMVLGFVQEVFSPTAAGGSADAAAAEQDFETLAATVPHLAAMVASEVHAAGDDALGWCDTDSEFAFTLDLLLDGLERAR